MYEVWCFCLFVTDMTPKPWTSCALCATRNTLSDRDFIELVVITIESGICSVSRKW
jgi:hypothetical protein